MEFCSAEMAELQQDSCLLLFKVFSGVPGVLWNAIAPTNFFLIEGRPAMTKLLNIWKAVW